MYNPTTRYGSTDDILGIENYREKMIAQGKEIP